MLEEKSFNEQFICGDIQFHDVNLVYPSRNDVSVLQNLNFIARANQTTALVGSSGSGKLFLEKFVKLHGI